MTPEDSQTETGEVLLAPFDLLEGTSESTLAKTAETLQRIAGHTSPSTTRIYDRSGDQLVGSWLNQFAPAGAKWANGRLHGTFRLIFKFSLFE
jgi:hypothetical protein